MHVYFSRIVAMVVLGSTLSIAADATNLEEVFTKGEVSGTIGWFGQHVDANGETPNSGFSNGYLNVGFETAPFHGVSLGVSGWGSVKTSEKNDDDFKSAIADRSVLSQAYLKVEHEGMGKVILGRQAVDYNWLGDYIDGVSAEIKAIDDLVVSFAWARKYSVVDIDEISEEFTKLNGSKGIYMIDAKYTPIKELELNPYLYYGNHLFSAYGMKATLTLEPTEEIKTTTMAHYVGINSDIANTKNDSFAQLEQGVEVYGVNVALGFMKTSKDGMVNSFSTPEGTMGIGDFGDQSPFEDGNRVFGVDAKTPYIRAEYEIEGIKLATIYGQTKYLDTTLGDKLKEKEFNFSVAHEFMKNLEAELIYVNVNNSHDDNSYDAIKAHLSYKF